jgi:hypothetical protein
LNAVTRALTRAPGQRQVSQTVERFVPHEFVGPPQRRADDSILVENDGVVERRALNQPLGPQRLHLVEKSKRPRRSELAGKRLRRDSVATSLPPDHRVRKINCDIDLEIGRRRDLVSRLAIRE